MSELRVVREVTTKVFCNTPTYSLAYHTHVANFFKLIKLYKNLVDFDRIYVQSVPH